MSVPAKVRAAVSDGGKTLGCRHEVADLLSEGGFRAGVVGGGADKRPTASHTQRAASRSSSMPKRRGRLRRAELLMPHAANRVQHKGDPHPGDLRYRPG